MAISNFGTLYWNGMGVATNQDQAIAWYRAAASVGNAPSQQWLKQRGLL